MVRYFLTYFIFTYKISIMEKKNVKYIGRYTKIKQNVYVHEKFVVYCMSLPYIDFVLSCSCPIFMSITVLLAQYPIENKTIGQGAVFYFMQLNLF